jgi:hypothetical protein
MFIKMRPRPSHTCLKGKEEAMPAPRKRVRLFDGSASIHYSEDGKLARAGSGIIWAMNERDTVRRSFREAADDPSVSEINLMFRESDTGDTVHVTIGRTYDGKGEWGIWGFRIRPGANGPVPFTLPFYVRSYERGRRISKREARRLAAEKRREAEARKLPPPRRGFGGWLYP